MNEAPHEREMQQENTAHSRSYFPMGRPKKKNRLFSLLKIFFALFVIGGLGAGIFALTFFLLVSKDLPDPNKIIEREIPLTTKIFDRTEKVLLYEIHGAEKRTMVELKDIPQNLIRATLTAEDRNFYQHRGFSLTGILRSIIKNVSSDSRSGGSTITQQLVKNAVLTSEKTYTRKAKEVILAYQIEKKFSKNQILKMYFNEIPYGSVIYGVEAASQSFFGKSVKEITLAQAAILAAIPQKPSYFSPSGSHVDKLLTRQKWILDEMKNLGYITQAQAQEAKKEEIVFQKSKEDILAPHFVMHIKEYLSEKYGEKTVGEGGLRVITTLDYEKQKIAEEAIGERAEKNEEQWKATNASLVSLDPKTGQILAMVGSRDYFNEKIDGQVNVSLRPRQPGSSFKPVVYAAAFKKGFPPETVVFDVNTKFTNYDGKPYEPKNYDLKEHGPVTFREALAGSLNVPAVQAIYLTGIDNVLDLADDLGYSTLKERWRFGLSLVLGGGEVKLLEHANAFAVFAAEGELRTVSGILRVEDREGNILEEYKNKKTKVLETQIARQITGILSDNDARAFIFGANNFLTLPDRPVAAKTGTTNDYHDAWTIGYTPSLVTGVWVGNSNNDPMKRGADGSVVAAPIWNAYMKKALENTPVEYFNPPQPTVTENPALNGSLKQGIKVKIDRVSGKLATEYTPPEFIEEKNYLVLRSILFYVDKDNPLGPAPENPAQDPEFPIWEAAILDWGKRNNIVSETPPQEYDDIHIPENHPALTIFSPQTRETLTSRAVTIDVAALSPRQIKKIEYYLGGKLIGEKYAPPYALSVFLDHNDIPNGFSSLRVVASDDVGNKTQEFIDIELRLPEISPGIFWKYPSGGNIITQDNFPLALTLEAARPENIESVNIYIDKQKQQHELIASVRQISQNTITVPWTNYPGQGIYGLEILVNNKDGYLYRSDAILIEIK